MGQHGFY
jgi:monoamine oxidase